MTKPEDFLRPDGLASLKPERRTTFLQPLSKKEPRTGDKLGTCGHVEPGQPAFRFDVAMRHEDTFISFLACCTDCAEAANFDITRVPITEVVSLEPSEPS